MRRQDWFLRVMVTLLVVGVWVLILRPVLAPTPIRAAEAATEAQGEVRAQRFVLVDEQGREAAVLGVTGEGGPALTMSSPEGELLLALGVSRRGAEYERHLNLWPEDARGASLFVLPDGEPSLHLQGTQGAKAEMWVGRHSGPGLSLRDQTGALLFAAPVGEGAREVATSYFKHLRESEVEKAKALAVFEDEKAEQEWERQVQDYVERRKAGAPAWWGQPFKVQKVPGPPSGEWAVVEAQWRYRTDLGWLMATHYSYAMRTVGGEWRMVVDNKTAERGIPWLPAEEP